MEIITNIKQMQSISDQHIYNKKTIGFVPTMGFLHEGHLKLIRRARKKVDILIVSIFVNPMQFGPNEDYKIYPRNFKNDQRLLKNEQVDYVFKPSTQGMYAIDFSTYVDESQISKVMCGVSRPGHFRGVATVVVKLWAATKAHSIYFGQKDAQQVQIVKRVFRDLNIDIKIVIIPTAREKSGLAYSSRNELLTIEEKKEAIKIYEALMWAKLEIASGITNINLIIQALKRILESSPLIKVDYIEIVSYPDFQKIQKIESKILIGIAVWVGGIRLIDNMIVEAQ